MSAPENPRARLLELIVAFRQTQCVRVAVEFGAADQLASGPAASVDLAAACGAKEHVCVQRDEQGLSRAISATLSATTPAA